MSLPTENKHTEIESLKIEISALKKELAWFKEQFQLMRNKQFGKKTEATNVLQYTLFDEHECDEVTETITPIDDEREQVTYDRSKPKPKQGRNIDTSNLPRTIQRHDLPDEEKQCVCGCQLVVIEEDKSEQIDIIPEQITVIEHVTPKYTCRRCNIIKSAKKPEAAIPKCMATEKLITDVIIKKYEHHLPLYRQSKILAGKSIDISDNTLGNWVMGAAQALSPLGEAFIEQLGDISELQVDETPVKILKPDKKGFMWCYHSLTEQNRFILYEYHLSRGSAVVEERLKHYRGLMQTDGYSAYNSFRKKLDVISLGCMDHARRKFADAIKIHGANQSGLAGELLKKINALYKIEREIKGRSLKAKRHARQTKSLKHLMAIKQLASSANVPAKSAIGAAITYLLNQWETLIEYTNHPTMPISNILVENLIRPLALGKKNWLFVGNEKSANQSALLYSLIQTCRINKINPQKYLSYVLSQAHQMRRGEVQPKALLPQFIDQTLL